MIFKCSAGKDRTGVMIAILLHALGVPHDMVVADYQRSDIFARNLRLRGGIEEQFNEAFGFIPEKELIDAMIGVDVALLDAAFDAIKAEFSDLDGYFAAAGIDAALLGRLRATMVAAT